MAKSSQKHLDAKIVDKITQLDLKARHIVEGFVAGMHKSPYHGFSVEFAKHRHYSPGDDIKHIDWKVFGRSDRLYIKEYELETNLRSNILLDTSESMLYGSGEHTKLELACYVAASMAYMILKQQDSVSMLTFDKGVTTQIPASSSMGHMRAILGTLAKSTASEQTDLGSVFHQTAEQIRRRSLIIVISDFFDDPDKIIKGLQHFRHRRHDVILFHIMDEYEVEFPFDRMTKFEGLEEMPKLLVDPRALRQAYLEEVRSFLEKIRKGCQRNKIDYCLLRTDRQLDVELTRYLAERLATRQKLSR